AHEVETALNLAREGKLAFTPAVIDVILESVDCLTRAVATVESGGACERSHGHGRLLAKVRGLAEEEHAAAESDSTGALATPSDASPQPGNDAPRQAA